MANGAPGILTAQASPEEARRSWPRWALLGVAMIALAVVSMIWTGHGARLLLGGIGLFLAGRGVVLLRSAGRLEGEFAARARRLGPGALGVGIAGVLVAAVSASLSSTVLLIGVPAVLLLGTLVLLSRGTGLARRAGLAVLVWTGLITGLLVVTGLAQGWDRATDVATVVTALLVAILGVPLLVSAANLRVVAAQPPPAPRPAGCAGCACGAGGCGSPA